MISTLATRARPASLSCSAVGIVAQRRSCVCLLHFCASLTLWRPLPVSAFLGKFYSAKYDGKKLHRANEKQLRKLVKNEDDYRLLVRALR